MNEFDKHNNTYKSVIGQLKRLEERSTDAEAKLLIGGAIYKVEEAYHIEITSFVAKVRRVLGTVAQVYSDVFANIARAFRVTDEEEGDNK